MGGVANILIVTICFSFLTHLIYPAHPIISSLDVMITDNLFGTGISLSLVDAIGIVLGAGAVSVVTGVISFPNPYIIFGTLAGFLVAAVTLPLSLLTDTSVPADIRTFVASIFGLLYLLAAISWYKGGETP